MRKRKKINKEKGGPNLKKKKSQFTKKDVTDMNYDNHLTAEYFC